MRLRLLLLVVFLYAVPQRAVAYSVLAHEATIDTNWDAVIVPLLQRRFGNLSDAALLRARSFAYGGAVIQDLGYYPFGSRFFSNLLHYVRSGDFVDALVRDSQNVDDYAFALGALAHYANDNTGHPEAVNLAVAMAFPKLRVKFGNDVRYVDAPTQHVIVEFSFDVVQAAGGEYLPEAYQRMIGFRVATDVLQQAFRETYGIEMRAVFADMDRSIATYRYSISQIIPALTEAAWRDKHDEILRLHPVLQRTGFVFAYGRRDFERDYGQDYQRPGWFARFLGVIYRVLPKVGPLRPLSFKTPTPRAEALFAKSFRDASVRFRAQAGQLGASAPLANTNLDTGKPMVHGTYALADETWADLLRRLSTRHFEGMPPALRRRFQSFYGPDPVPSAVSRHERRHWKRLRADLDELKKKRSEG